MRLALLALALAGCTDLSNFVGDWSGTPVDDAALLVGMPRSTPVTLRLEAVDRVAIGGAITVGGETVALRPLARAANDALGALDLPDAPLRSYFAAASLHDGDVLCVVSVYGDDHVDLRLIRSDTLYAVYHLKR